MKYERGDVVEASDPFNGGQYVAVTLTTRTWYDETIPITEDDFLDGGLPKDSYLVPWGIVSLPHDDILDWFGRIERAPLDETVDQLIGYLRE